MAKAQSEPTMDEILASIRRIISEEDEAPTNARTSDLEPLQLDDDAAVSDIELEEEAAQASAASGDPLGEEELTGEEPEMDDQPEENIAMHPAATTSEAFEAVGPSLAEEAPAAAGEAQDTTSAFEEKDQVQGTPEFKPTANTYEEVTASAGMISDTVTQRASEAFGMLQDSLRISSGNSRTVEDLVEAMLRPMIQDWLEQNLPRIVEEKVEEEVRRIARRR